MKKFRVFGSKVKFLYRKSVFGKLCSFVAESYAKSAIFSLHRAGNLDTAFEQTALIKKTRESTARTSCGMILNFLRGLADHLSYISFGQTIFTIEFWLAALFLHAITQGAWSTAVVFAVMCVLLLPLCFVKASLRSLISTSFIGRFFGFNFTAKSKKQNKWLLAVLILPAVISAFWLKPGFSLLPSLFIVALIFITYVKPIFFISLLMICLPIFGTSICITLSVLIFLSHLLQRAFDKIEKTQITYIDILLFVFMVLCLVACLFSFAMGDSLRVSVMWLLMFSTVFIIYRNVNNSHDLIMVLSSLLIGAFIACLIGIGQYLSGEINTTWTDTELFESLNIRVYGTFANPNVFGEFLLLVVPFCVGLGIYFNKIKYKVICFVLTAISLITLALTYSRGCYAGIAVTAVVFLWMYNKKILGVLVALGVPAGIAMMPQNMLDRILSIVNFADTSTSYRLKIYQGTFGLLKTYWQSGVGIGETAFNYVYPFFGVQGIVAPHSHSLFLQLMVSFGIAGILYFVILLFVYHRNIISTMYQRPNSDRNKVLLITFGSVLSGFLVQSIFDYTWYNYRVYMLFWVVLSLGFATYKFLKDEVLLHD